MPLKESSAPGHGNFDTGLCNCLCTRHQGFFSPWHTNHPIEDTPVKQRFLNGLWELLIFLLSDSMCPGSICIGFIHRIFEIILCCSKAGLTRFIISIVLLAHFRHLHV
ncbi:hypothetical protein RSAG8_03289, partial [Rhizoctonia solani AG-8 WAC10335]